MDSIDKGKGGGDKSGENPPAKRSKIKKDPDSGGDGGGGGGNSGGGGGSSGIRAGLAHAPPSSDLVAVGIILAQPSPKYQAGSGGRMVNVSVETWMTDLYRCNQWWIALPNVEDVSDVNRGRVMIKAIPLSAPTGAYSLVDVASGSQGRMRMEGMKLALFGSGNSDGWDMLAGTPPAWFATIWDKSSIRRCDDESTSALANQFKNAKIFVTHAQVLQQQRDWLNQSAT